MSFGRRLCASRTNNVRRTDEWLQLKQISTSVSCFLKTKIARGGRREGRIEWGCSTSCTYLFHFNCLVISLVQLSWRWLLPFPFKQYFLQGVRYFGILSVCRRDHSFHYCKGIFKDYQIITPFVAPTNQTTPNQPVLPHFRLPCASPCLVSTHLLGVSGLLLAFSRIKCNYVQWFQCICCRLSMARWECGCICGLKVTIIV